MQLRKKLKNINKECHENVTCFLRQCNAKCNELHAQMTSYNSSFFKLCQRNKYKGSTEKCVTNTISDGQSLLRPINIMGDGNAVSISHKFAQLLPVF